MERLIKSQYWTLVWIAGACLGLMILILPRLPDHLCTLPLWLLVLGEWLFAFLILLTTQFKSLRQSLSNLRIEPACLSLALIFFVSAIAIIFSPLTQLSANWVVSIGAGQLIVMTIGVLASIATIERIHNYDEDQEVNNALALQRVTSTRIKRPGLPKSTGNKLGLIFKKSAPATETIPASPSPSKLEEAAFTAGILPVEVEATGIGLPQQQMPSDMTKKDEKKSALEELPIEIRRLPSVHPNKPANKITDPNKRTSSTLTKLQALSASGIGSVHHPNAPVDTDNIVQPPQALEPNLRSVLDRLDAPKQSAAEELPAISPLPSLETDISIEPAASPASVPSVFRQSVDKEMDDIFAKIAPIEAQQEVKHMDENTAAVAPATSEPKLFQGKIDDQVEELFSEIASPEAQRDVSDFTAHQTKPQSKDVPLDVSGYVINQMTPDNKHVSNGSQTAGQGTVPSGDAGADADMLAQQNIIAQELKDFGRLSIKASHSTASAPIGTMKTIGKLLIDSQDVDNIIKRAEAGNITVNLPSARIISTVRGEGIQSLLEGIDNYHGVAGSMLVGGDGLVIASTYTAAGDREGTGVLAHGMLGNSNLAVLRLDLGKLEQMIFVSELIENDSRRPVTTILTDVDVGALAVFVDSPLVISLDQLLEQLSTVARG